jgi:hypothetical protein
MSIGPNWLRTLANIPKHGVASYKLAPGSNQVPNVLLSYMSVVNGIILLFGCSQPETRFLANATSCDTVYLSPVTCWQNLDVNYLIDKGKRQKKEVGLQPQYKQSRYSCYTPLKKDKY